MCEGVRQVVFLCLKYIADTRSLVAGHLIVSSTCSKGHQDPIMSLHIHNIELDVKKLLMCLVQCVWVSRCAYV